MNTHRHRHRRTVRYCPLEPPWRYPDVLAAAVPILVPAYTEPGHRVLLVERGQADHADRWDTRPDEAIETILRLGRGATTAVSAKASADDEDAVYDLIVCPRTGTTPIAEWARLLSPARNLIVLTIPRALLPSGGRNDGVAPDSALRREAALAGLALVDRVALLHHPPSARPPCEKRQRLAVTLGGHRPSHSEAHVFQPNDTERARANAPRHEDGENSVEHRA